MLMLTQKLYRLIPDSYPISCEDGWLLSVNENETRLNCTNELCPVDGALRLDKALDILEIDCEIGPIGALKLTLRLGLNYHMDIFNKLEHLGQVEHELETGDITHLNSIVKYMNDIENHPIDLHKFMSCWCFEPLGSTNSQKVFVGLENLEEFYDLTQQSKIVMNEFVGKRLGISPYCDTVNNITRFMKSNKDILLETASKFKFKKKKSGKITVTITGDVVQVRRENGSAYKPRDKFIEAMSDKYGVNITYSKHITQTLDFLICDGDNGHTKINKVMNDPAYSNLKLVTSKEFEDYLRSMDSTKITAF